MQTVDEETLCNSKQGDLHGEERRVTNLREPGDAETEEEVEYPRVYGSLTVLASMYPSSVLGVQGDPNGIITCWNGLRCDITVCSAGRNVCTSNWRCKRRGAVRDF